MKRAFKRAGVGSSAISAPCEHDRILKDLDKLEQTFRQWLRTGSPIDSRTIQVVLQGPYLQFKHRAPGSGSSHSTLTHPSGQVVGLVAGTEVLGYQIAAAKAGLAVLKHLRANILKKEAPDYRVERAKDDWRKTLGGAIPPAFDLSPLDGAEKGWILRSRSFPQIGALVYEGMPKAHLSPVLERLIFAQERLEHFMERADTLEFDVVHQDGTLTLTHRVHEGVACIFKPYDPRSNHDPQTGLDALDAFEREIAELDRQAEDRRQALIDTRLYIEQEVFDSPDKDYRIVTGHFVNPLSDTLYQFGYTDVLPVFGAI